MNRKRAILICCVAFIVTVVAIAWPRGPKEPEYQGKKLSEWIASSGFTGSPEERRAAAAIQHMATNALPLLVKWVSYDEPAWKSSLISKCAKAPAPLPYVSEILDRANRRAVDASWAIGAAGAAASDYVKEIGLIFGRTNNQYVRVRIMAAFFGLDKSEVSLGDAVPGILRGEAHMRARHIMGNLDTSLRFFHADAHVRAALMQALHDADPGVRTGATNAWLQIDPDILTNAALNQPSH